MARYGHMTKKEYINHTQSKQWREIRKKIIVRDGGCCIQCGSSVSLAIHHTTYANVGDEENHLDDLTLLCKSCHQRQHNRRRLTEEELEDGEGCLFCGMYKYAKGDLCNECIDVIEWCDLEITYDKTGEGIELSPRRRWYG